VETILRGQKGTWGGRRGELFIKLFGNKSQQKKWGGVEEGGRKNITSGGKGGE